MVGYYLEKNKQLHIYPVLLVFIFLSTINLSCNKEENALPIITVTSPLENSSFSILDKIPVHAEIEDDDIINSIVVVLVDEELKPVTASKNYFPNSKTYTLIDDFTIPGGNLNTGNYYLKIQAIDDHDFKNEYVKVYIEGASTHLEQIIILTQPDANQIEVSGVTNFETVQEIFTLEGDYSASEVSSTHHKLFISGIEKINLRAYDLITNMLDWEKGIIPEWPMHNMDCMYFDEWLYVTFNDRDIFGYDYKGIEKYNSVVGDFDAPGRIYKHKNYVLSDIQKKNGTNPFISVFHAASGIEANRLNTTFEVVNFISLSDDIVLLIANTEENGYIGEYNIVSNILSDRIFADTHFFSSIEVNSSAIYISTPAEIRLYNPNTNVLTPVLSKQGVKHMVYEEISDLLIVSTTNELQLLNLPEMTNQKTLLFSDLILNIHLLYSK